MINKVIDNIKTKNLVKRYFYLIVALFVSSICYNLLLYPLKIVAGGANGISILVESIFNIPPSRFILFFSVAVLIIAVFVLGIEKSSGSVVATFIYPFFVEITSGITSIIDLNKSDAILICLFAGVISGWVSGTIYKMGFSSGGVSLINQMIYEKTKISISKVNFFINSIIVFAGGIYYGMTNVMYAVIVLYITGIVIDRVLLGISNHKIFYIITSKDDEVQDYLLKEMGHGVTKFDVVSGYLNNDDEVLMAVVPTREYFKVKEGIKEIDKNSFFVVTDSYETLNGA